MVEKYITAEELEMKLGISFEEYPFEDGFSHPAEDIIAGYLKTRDEKSDFLHQLFLKNYEKNPYFCEGILRCIGSIKTDKISGFGYDMANMGLKHKDAGIREASVSAFESWGGIKAVEMLSEHDEKEAYLKNYIEKVLKDLKNEI